MKLTSIYLKKLIKEELKKTLLNEAMIDWAIIAAYVYVKRMETEMRSEESRLRYNRLMDKRAFDSTEMERTYELQADRLQRQSHVLIVVLLIRSVIKIMGHLMQEEYAMEPSMDGSQLSHDELISAFRSLSIDEVEDTLRILSSKDPQVMDLDPEELMNVSDGVLMDLIDTYDPVGIYNSQIK
mgnify:CR=1 FL=1|tara:strand:- start:1317 stop:1865 length:549 start_codon:yes stop_codon:yes gene_type:complete